MLILSPRITVKAISIKTFLADDDNHPVASRDEKGLWLMSAFMFLCFYGQLGFDTIEKPLGNEYFRSLCLFDLQHDVTWLTFVYLTGWIIIWLLDRTIIEWGWVYLDNYLDASICHITFVITLAVLGMFILRFYLRFLRRGEAKAAERAGAAIQQASVEHGTERMTMAEIDEEIKKTREARRGKDSRAGSP